MRVDSVYFKGHGCFKEEWGGFDTIKPINVIIGRNNSGKSHLLDLVQTLRGGDLTKHEWQYRFKGVLDEASLKSHLGNKRVFGGPLSGDLYPRAQGLVGQEMTWDLGTSGGKSGISNLRFLPGLGEALSSSPSPSSQKELTEAWASHLEPLLLQATHPFKETAFRRLLADRDIKTELSDTDLSLRPDGQGATNIIRRFLLTSREELRREVIQEELREGLNSIFEGDGHFAEIAVQVHDQEEDQRDQWEVYLREERKGLIPLSNSGSGLKTVLLVLLNLLVIPAIQRKEKSQFTYAFEELENNLHPALLRRFFGYLEKYALDEKATIFLTTHSSIALDAFGLSDHAQIVRVSHDGVSARTTTVPTHSGYLRILSELGARPSDLLQANGLIWVEGPSDRIYLNRWIDLHSDGDLREGRDYQCAFYGGALLARIQFMSPEDGSDELANLLRINHNFVVVCDSDRESEDSDLKLRVTRIREEVEAIEGAHIWITEAREIENYLPGSVLAKASDSPQLPDPRSTKAGLHMFGSTCTERISTRWTWPSAPPRIRQGKQCRNASIGRRRWPTSSSASETGRADHISRMQAIRPRSQPVSAAHRSTSSTT